MGLSAAKDLLVNFITSRQLLPGSWANAVTNFLTSIQTATASTTQTQAGGTPITAASAAITTANADDAVTLPKGYAGAEVFIANLSANALGVFPAVDDTIFPSAADAVLAQTASKNAIYKCVKVTSAGACTWYRNLSA
jgi:hypothetical protein